MLRLIELTGTAYNNGQPFVRQVVSGLPQGIIDSFISCMEVPTSVLCLFQPLSWIRHINYIVESFCEPVQRQLSTSIVCQIDSVGRDLLCPERRSRCSVRARMGIRLGFCEVPKLDRSKYGVFDLVLCAVKISLT